jgi:hypothetical protein
MVVVAVFLELYFILDGPILSVVSSRRFELQTFFRTNRKYISDRQFAIHVFSRG